MISIHSTENGDSHEPLGAIELIKKGGITHSWDNLEFLARSLDPIFNASQYAHQISLFM